MARILWAAIWVLAGMSGAGSNAFAADIETLFMPGKVIEGHAKWETQCAKCHSRFSKTTQNRLCLDCHEDIAKDVDAKRGFHGLSTGVRDAECKSCHSEHLGRDAHIVPLNRATFDHDLTDFKLEGTHKALVCDGCHKPGKKFAEAPAQCYACHREQDRHNGNLGKKCDQCHTPKRWNDFEFDHDDTDFPLEGKHRDVECHSCHVSERYKDIASDCKSCHALNDAHNGLNGDKCGDCHSPNKWDESKFDHDRDTKFALRGAHRKTACEACHREPVETKKPTKDCYGCHRDDDRHQGRNGKKCQSCHNETSWGKASFNHDKETEFPLRGKHRDLECTSCHRGELATENLSVACADCHRADDVHKGQEGEQCDRCHREEGWSQKVAFDHDLTHFPLIGMHATAPCEECHLSSAFKHTATDCYSCHKQKDEHRQTLGTACGRCHNPNDWLLWRFDHDNETDFRLEGAHADLHCENCHTAPMKDDVRQSRNCNACHAQDDIHRGRFGRNCERCHATDQFSNVRIER